MVASMGGSTLSPEQLGRTYDRIGRIQDWQGFYEAPAIDDMLDHADLGHARSVFELGCGTGASGSAWLDELLPPDATYVGVDVSSKMVQLSTERLARFGDRATVRQVNGRAPLPGESGRFDRFVALYVFDLLSESLARELLDEAGRLLTADGRLCLVSLSHGTTTPSRIVSSLWNRAWRVAPKLLGGCRPIDLRQLLEGWEVEHLADLTAWAVPSQVVVATRSTTST